ncbi:MAG TPA: precorrin-2 C(20)-methyltransferase [Devosiaceae bacterium]|jgi:precorrin-2/cobalt-factor-2 C20-methyltransferase
MMAGRLFGLGVGPGDPELITLKALKRLQAAPVVAFFAARGRKGNAYSIIETLLRPGQQQLRLDYPVTRATLHETSDYETLLSGFYDSAAATLATHLDAGRDVAVACEGDPLFYGSYMYLHDRLADRYVTEVVPGVSSVFASAAVLGAPLVYRDQGFSVIAGTLSPELLKQRLAAADAAAIMKLGGGNLTKVRQCLAELGLMSRALYVERATMAEQRIVPLAEVEADTSPYFSLVLLPGRKWLS